MANFTAQDVRELREKTGVGMMDCKKALTEADGIMEKAMEILREKGLSAAAKKSGRIAAEGIVHTVVDKAARIGVVVEVNAETDFVGKNADFVKFVDDIAQTIIKQNPADLDTLMGMKLNGSDITITEALQEKILVIGENMNVRRFARYTGVVTTYTHGEGRIGVMVGFDAEDSVMDKPEFEIFGKDIAMQIAAVSPLYVGVEEVPADVVEKEKEILTTQALNEGKPANVVEKMVAGRIHKYFESICLMEQGYVKNSDLRVSGYVEETSKKLGTPVGIKKFVRFEKGEGIEKKEDNFADEVASMMK